MTTMLCRRSNVCSDSWANSGADAEAHGATGHSGSGSDMCSNEGSHRFSHWCTDFFADL